MKTDRPTDNITFISDSPSLNYGVGGVEACNDLTDMGEGPKFWETFWCNCLTLSIFLFLKKISIILFILTIMLAKDLRRAKKVIFLKFRIEIKFWSSLKLSMTLQFLFPCCSVNCQWRCTTANLIKHKRIQQLNSFSANVETF